MEILDDHTLTAYTETLIIVAYKIYYKEDIIYEIHTVPFLR